MRGSRLLERMWLLLTLKNEERKRCEARCSALLTSLGSFEDSDLFLEQIVGKLGKWHALLCGNGA